MARTKHVALGAILTALALALSYMERLIPLQLLIPLPGIKLGLANLVTVFALYTLGTRQTAAILLLRCTLGAAFSSGVLAWLFSVTGGALALVAMVILCRLPALSIYGVCLGGAACHNLGQILAAALWLHTAYVWAYLPFLLLVSLATGALTGFLSARVLQILSHGSWRFAKDSGSIR